MYIMWFIILAGGAFIFKHALAPNTISPEENLPQVNTEIITEGDLNKSAEEFISIGDSYMDYNYPEKAATFYLRALDKQPDSLIVLRKLSEAYLASSQNLEAIETLTTALAFKPNSESLNLLLARAHLANRSIETAKDIIWQLDEAKPENTYYKGVIYLLYKEYDLAKSTLLGVEALDPQNQEQLEIKEKALKILAAFDTFAYYKESNPAFLDLLIAKSLGENGEHGAAIPILFAIINENSNYRDAWIVLGYNYLMSHQYLDAIDSLKQAVDLDKEKPQSLFYLGLAYFANNDIEDAIIYLQKAKTAGYTPVEQIDIKLGDLYALQNSFEKAESYYQKVLDEQGQNINLYARLVWLKLEKLDQPKEALNLALAATTNFPEEALSHSLAGWAYTALGNYGQAKKYLNTALELNPNLDQANFHIAWLYQKQGQDSLAKNYYKQAFILGNGNDISVLAAKNFNQLSEQEKKSFLKANITSP